MSLIAIQPDDLPSPKRETWKYTNLPRAVKRLPENLQRSDDEEEIIIHLKKNEVRDAPIEVRFEGCENCYHQNQFKIKLEEGAQATVIEIQDGQGAYWKNRVTDIELEAGAQLTHIRIQDDAIDAVNTNICHIRAARDAVYNAVSLNQGGRLTRHEIYAEILGENAEVSFNGLNMLSGKQHGDTTIVVQHKAPHGRSNQFYRSVLADEAHGVFQGKVHVHQIAQKTDGYQLSNTLLLSPLAHMDTKPELEIYADDVKCSHGATCGALDEDPLFYMRARGIPEGQARKLLIQAFVGEIVDKIADETMKAQAESRIEEWLDEYGSR